MSNPVPGFMLENFTAERKPRDPPRPYILLFDVTVTETQVLAQAFLLLEFTREGAVLIFRDFALNARVIARVPSIPAKTGELILKPIAFERVE